MHARIEAIAIERAAMLAYARDYQQSIRAMAGRARITSADAEVMCRQIQIFAEGIAHGLHLHATDSRAVRVAVRAAVEEVIEIPASGDDA